MHRSARAAASVEGASRWKKWLGSVLIAGIAIAAAGWYLFESRWATRLADRTIALQERLLGTQSDASERRRALDEIMRTIDRLPPAEIRRVRESLFKRINTMRIESLDRFAQASPDERAALLDEDLDRIRLVRGIMDATDQGGMRPHTEAELLEREQKRRQQEQAKKEAPAANPQRPTVAARPPARPRPPTAEQQRATEYIEALTKRAKEKKVDLGRMFSRPPGRG